MVEVGDDVRKGDVLLELDPLSAPQNVIEEFPQFPVTLDYDGFKKLFIETAKKL